MLWVQSLTVLVALYWPCSTVLLSWFGESKTGHSIWDAISRVRGGGSNHSLDLCDCGAAQYEIGILHVRICCWHLFNSSTRTPTFCRLLSSHFGAKSCTVIQPWIATWCFRAFVCNSWASGSALLEPNDRAVWTCISTVCTVYRLKI